RAWIIQGFVQGGPYRNLVGHLEYLSRAIDIIKWGREQFRDIQKDVRDAIFKATFLRGVQTLHLAAFLEGLPHADAEMLEEIYQEADEVIAGVDAATIPLQRGDPGFIPAFYYHTKGYALSYVFSVKLAHRMKAQPNLSSSYTESIMKNLHLASQYYVKAANCFAEDDENHAWLFLKAALEMMWSCKTSARDQLVIMERLRLAIPKIKQRGWAHSSLGKQQGDSFSRWHLTWRRNCGMGRRRVNFDWTTPSQFQIEN
ncbi:hypothetical protein EV368DRAFT_52086, partial [Lentinula lateritia]